MTASLEAVTDPEQHFMRMIDRLGPNAVAVRMIDKARILRAEEPIFDADAPVPRDGIGKTGEALICDLGVGIQCMEAALVAALHVEIEQRDADTAADIGREVCSRIEPIVDVGQQRIGAQGPVEIGGIAMKDVMIEAVAPIGEFGLEPEAIVPIVSAGNADR